MKKIISIINLKGGVAKTTTAVNFAYELAVRGNRVLAVDNDKQGNLSKAFRCYDPSEQYTVAYLMTEKDADVSKAVAKTEYENIDIIPANMNLANANMSVMMDMSRQQQTRLHKAFADGGIYEKYDYIVIDNAPDINISIINALTISTDVIVPLIIDQYSMDGLDILMEQLQQVKEDFNDGINFDGCLVTQWQKNDVNTGGLDVIKKSYPVFDIKIRRTNAKVQESTFAKIPLIEYSRRCGASIDYKKFVDEWLGRFAK